VLYPFTHTRVNKTLVCSALGPSLNLRHIGMDAEQFLPEVPDDLKFRVLIIGRANAGKTSILQRVCDTTESPEIYRHGPQGKRERVRSYS
jgi:hypothetical protein